MFLSFHLLHKYNTYRYVGKRVNRGSSYIGCHWMGDSIQNLNNKCRIQQICLGCPLLQMELISFFNFLHTLVLIRTLCHRHMYEMFRNRMTRYIWPWSCACLPVSRRYPIHNRILLIIRSFFVFVFLLAVHPRVFFAVMWYLSVILKSFLSRWNELHKY